MGLDMYLYSYGEEGKRGGVLPELWISWRKANAIHWWFVTEIQGGVDLCEEHPVQREKLVELMGLCNEAASLHWIEALELLPTMPGPFFGSVSYDEYYYWVLKDTAARLKALLDAEESKTRQFYYQSSW